MLTFKEYELRKGGGCGGVLGVKGTQKSRYRDEKFVIFRATSGLGVREFHNFSRTPNPRFCTDNDEFFGGKAHIP